MGPQPQPQHQNPPPPSDYGKAPGRIQSMFGNATSYVSKLSGIKQFAYGGATGWLTGFLTTKVGKSVGATVGGTMILIAAAQQADFVNINWDKIDQKTTDVVNKVEKNVPVLKTSIGAYAKSNRLFAAGFVGGFLLGLTS